METKPGWIMGVEREATAGCLPERKQRPASPDPMSFPRFSPNRSPAVVFFLALVSLLSGCSTIASRIEEKAAVYDNLDPQVQAMIRQGRVELGYTPEMVYMALGHPDEHSEHVTTEGRQAIWIYTSTYETYAGTAQAGYRRVLVRNPQTNAAYIYLQPVYTDLYQDQTEENIRVIFHDGYVSAIEEARPKTDAQRESTDPEL
jgi:hypothetical protein